MQWFGIAWVYTAFWRKEQQYIFHLFLPCVFRQNVCTATNEWACAHSCRCSKWSQCVLHKFTQYKSYLCRMQLCWINALIVSLRVSCNTFIENWSQFPPGQCEWHYEKMCCKKKTIINANYDWFSFFTHRHNHQFCTELRTKHHTASFCSLYKYHGKCANSYAIAIRYKH